MSDAERKNKIYMTAFNKAKDPYDLYSDEVDQIYKKELKSRNPDPKKPKVAMKKDVVPKKMKASGGRVNLRGGGICKKGINKKAYGANS